MSGRARAVLGGVRRLTDVRRYAMRVLDDLGHAPLGADLPGGGAVRTAVVGWAPQRVLVFGGGLAVGYGVRSRRDAFDGPLAELLAAGTGRGVVLENRAVQHIRLPQTVDSLGAVGTHTFDLAIWCPAFVDGLERLRLRAWRDQLHAMIRELRATEQVPLLLTEMPVPAGRHPAAIVARPWVQRLNRVIVQVAREHDEVATVPTEPFLAREVGEPVTDPAYFAAVAGRIAPVALDLMGVRRRAASIA